MNELLSHAERVARGCDNYADYTGTYEELSKESGTTRDGRIVPNIVTSRVVDPSERYSGMTAQDFSLENIIACGAEGMLRDTYFSKGKLDVVSSLEDYATMMNEVLDSMDPASGNNEQTPSEE